jgi:hypothetical protein
MSNRLPSLVPPMVALGDSAVILRGLRQIAATAAFASLCKSAPSSDVEAMLAASASKSVDEMRATVVVTRFCNAVCNKCFSREHAKLLACAQCNITFYCSKACQTQDWLAHQLWCGKPHPTADKGPLRLVIVNKDKS